MESKRKLNKLPIACRHIACVVVLGMLATQSPSHAQTPPKQQRLLDRQAFDRITLTPASGGDVIDTLLLDLPGRRVPNPLPSEGALELRRLSEPSVLYKVPWNSVARVEFFEGMLLQEALTLAKAKDLDQAYEYLSFLYKNYPGLPGLKQATARYLRQDAQLSYVAKDYEATLTVLLSLYDLDPQYRGLKSMVEAVTNRMIQKHLGSRDFAAARSVLDMLENGFAELKASNVDGWQRKFEQGAMRQLSNAQKFVEAKRYSEARRAVRQALAILPEATGAAEMMSEIDRLAPQLIVGVDQLVTQADQPLDWSTARIAQLTDPKLVTLADFGAEGGAYECEWGKLSSDDTGLLLNLDLNREALSQGFSAEAIALQLLRRSDPESPGYRPNFAGLLDSIEIGRGNQVKLHWQRSHVRPEALLDLSLNDLSGDRRLGTRFEVSVDQELENQVSFRSVTEAGRDDASETIIERYYDNDEMAIADLIGGEIDVLARVPSWQVARLEQTTGIDVVPYRLPTVHALIPNYDQPLMGRREFRRAICYGIDREQILNGILLGGEQRAGYRVLSAPIPAGITITDPVGYAYNQGRQPRSYEPRLAAVLSAVARNSLAKLAALKAKRDQADKDNSNEAPTDSESSEEEAPVEVKVEPIVLAHPSNPTATTVCQTIKLQLGAIGIPVKLMAMAAQETHPPAEYDLRYAELAIWEPIVDVGKLLGPDGVAGSCSSSMSLALRDVEQAKNWKEVRSRLRDVHEIAFNDLPVIPLWQTIDFFAHRQSLRGVGATPVTLYQSLEQWTRSSSSGGSR